MRLGENGCCLSQVRNFSDISLREQVTFDVDDVCFVLDQHPELDLYIANSLKQQFTGRHVALIQSIILTLDRKWLDIELEIYRQDDFNYW